MGKDSIFSSGKTAADENFPVGSWLISARLRPYIHGFYRFARTADDVADAAGVPAAEKLARLARMEAALDGETGQGEVAAEEMARLLGQCGVSGVHCRDLLAAFRLDAVASLVVDWAGLMDYCRLSAAPVGRMVLELHGEDRASWAASDALCAALQVINHLQDCGTDYRTAGRVCLPLAVGKDLAADRCSPALRSALDDLVARTRLLLDQAAALPGQIRSLGLRKEVAVIIALAERLLERLAVEDPLAGRVRLSRWDVVRGVVRGLW